MYVKRIWQVIVLAALGGAVLGGANPRTQQRMATVVSRVSADFIRRHTVVLGSDALEGRAPGTRGGRRAADYIAEQLAEFAVDPAGDRGGYFQMVPLHGSMPLATSELRLKQPGEEKLLAVGDDYLLFTTGSQTEIPQPVPVVFVGYGIVAPEFDYSDYADVDVRGRVVVYLPGEPPSDTPDFFFGQLPTVYSSLEAKKRIALSRGARGSFLLPIADGYEDRAWAGLQRSFAFEDLSLAYAIPSHLSGIFNPWLAEWLFASALYDWGAVRQMLSTGTVRSFHLPVRLAFDGRFRSRDVMAPNVVARIVGRDPSLSQSPIVVSAHYDHLGIGPEIGNDSIYNGVVDNAIGVAAVLEIARVLSGLAPPPRRSVIFLFSTAEEEGLLGTQYFLDHPPRPLSEIAANVNVDGVAFQDTFRDVIGVGADLSTLGKDLAAVAKKLGLEIGEVSPELWSSESFSRSDQAAFAERGIPSILVNEGFWWDHASRAEAENRTIRWLERIYHTPADDLNQELSWDAARQHTALIAALVLRLANSREAPEWCPGVSYAYERALSRATGR
jgi:hypothetical protein